MTQMAHQALAREAIDAVARRMVRADRADQLLAEAQLVLASTSANHDRRACACEPCGMVRRITFHLGRDRC